MKDGFVGSEMAHRVVYMQPQDRLQEAFEIMQERRIRHIPIVEDKRLVGVLSDRDVLLASAPHAEGGVAVPDLAVDEVMSRHPITCLESTSISDVATMMVERKIDCLPVLNQRSRLVGMITSTNLLELLIAPDDRSARDRPLPEFVVESLEEYRAAAANN